MREEITIRQADSNDLKSIIALSKKLMEYDFKFDDSMDVHWPISDNALLFYREKFASKNDIILIAVYDREIIGFLIGGLVEPLCYRKIKILAELEEIVVKETFRNSKIGSKLMAQFFSWCHDKKAERIQVRVSAGNQKAISLYKKIGFKDHDIILEVTC